MVLTDTKLRSFVKALVWRLGATVGTWTVLLIFTHEPFLSLRITITAIVLGTIMYYLYERIWNMISWGKIKS